MHTSENNPLRIDSVKLPREMGEIGMTICPGKICHGMSGNHHRNLAADMEAIRGWGAEILVSLMEEHEYFKVGVGDMGAVVPKGIKHFKLPIRDVDVPDVRWERDWEKHGPQIRAVLHRGGKVCIHCMGGLGRTGLVTARILVEFGFSPEEAIQAVRIARPGTIETNAQEQYVRSFETTWRIFDRARGSLLAGACGDALGATVEFIDKESILAAYGPMGIRDLVDNGYGPAGRITDDTQMTLFTAEGLIRAKMDGCGNEAPDYGTWLHHSYLQWLHTQGCKVPIEGYAPSGRLMKKKEMHCRRAPGATCLGSLSAATGYGKPLKAENRSKGCGGVMRAAPVGIFMAAKGSPEEESRRLSFHIGCASARLTHGHPSGYLSAGAFALIIHDLVLGLDLAGAAERAISFLEREVGAEETISKLKEALRLAKGSDSPESCIEALGEGWVGEEALAISVFCALRSNTLEEGICMAVNIKGDSDSTGSIAGNLLGAMQGCKAIPSRWLGRLELKNTIQYMAEDLIFIHDASRPWGKFKSGNLDFC